MGLYEIAKQQAKIEGYDIDESLAEANAKRHIGRLESRAGTTTLTGQELSSLTNGASYEDVSSMIERPWNPLHENIPYLMAENQSVGAKIGGFANQLQGEIIGGAIEGFGYLGDVAHWGDRLSGGEGDWGNWLSDVGTSYKDLTRDLTPIYQHHPGEAFDPGDFGWWMSNAVSVGSSLSLLIPAAGATMALGKLGKMTGMLDKAVKLGSKLGLAAESTKMLGTVMGRAMFSRHMENMMEANGTFDEIKNKQLQLGKSEEEATRLASGGAADVYRNNWPLVIQDIAQMALIAKGPNFTKAVDSAAVATAAGMSAKGALLKAGYTKGWDMLTEGAEEAYQFVVGEEAKYSVDVATGLKPKSNFGDRLGEYAKDGHLWTSALFGALGAGVMQAAGPLVNKLTSGEYNPETAARVEEIKTRGVTYAAASKLYREAANADSKEGIEHASDFMALDLVTRAEATGNLDLQFKQLDDFKTMSKEERAAENFDEGMVERIDDIKSRMQEIVEMSKNIRKTHDPLVRYNVAMRMLQNKRFNKTLQESKVNESVNTNAIPRHSDLSSFGKSSLNDILDLNAVNSAIAATSQMLQGNITDFAKSKLEQTLKNYEAKRDAIAAKLDSEEANTNITEEDRKIIDSYQNSPFVDKVIVDKVKTIIAKDAIDRNNEEIAHLGSKEGIEDYKRVVAKARKKQADKDAKDAQDKLDADNAAADALVKAKSKEEELGKLTTELTPSDEELLKSMPEGHLIGKTDAELQAIADQQGLELSDVKVWQQADIEAFNKLKEQAANTAKTKAKEKLAEASKTNDEFIPTADNTTQIDFTESLPERESPKITTGHALAWKSSGNATSSELDKLNNKELSNFLEDPNIDLSAYDVVFSIDEEKLEKESKYEGIAEQLAAGNFENIGEVPVKGVFHLNGVPVLSPSDKPYTVYIHDSTYEYFAEQHREDAIAEAIALKTAVVAAKPGTTISTKIVNKSKGHLNVDKQGNKFIFHSLAESINDKSDKLEFAVGGNGGIYLNTAENKDIHNSLVGLLSARPGAVYTLVKTANGKVVPIRTWVSKLDEQEATLLYNTYKDILNKPQEYQNKLSKEFKEANASILTSLPINTATITYKELLEFFVFEGALTKDMGGRQLYTTKDGTLHIAGEVIDIQTMNTPEGMTKFVNLITAGNFRQISRTRLADNSYKAYVSKNNILTTNVVKVNNNIFVQPTLTIGALETKSTSVDQQDKAASNDISDKVKQIEVALLSLNDKVLDVNPNNTNEYIDTDGNTYARVSTLNGEKTFTNSEAADRGTIIDTILREFISGTISSVADVTALYESLDKKQSKPMDKAFLADLHSIFTEIKSITSNLKIVSTIPTLWGTLRGSNFAGTIDLLAIDKTTGDVFIIDLKTSTRNRRDSTDKYHEVYKQSDTTQQSAYAELLRQRTGITVKNIVILPIQVSSKNNKYTGAVSNKDSNGNLTMPVSINRSIFPNIAATTPVEQQAEVVSDAKADIERRRKEELNTTKQIGEDKLKEGRDTTKKIVESLKQRYPATSVQGIVIRILEKLIDFNKYSTIIDSDYLNGRNASGQATWFGMIISQETLDGILKGKEFEVHTFIHEFIHGFTTSKISDYNIEKQGLIPGFKSNLTAKEKNAIEQLQRIFEKVKRDNPKSKEYGFTNLDEFIAEAFSNSSFQYTLKNTKAEGKKSNLFSEFINAIGDLLFEQLERWAKRFNKEIPNRETITGILEDVLAWTEELIDQNNKLAYIGTNEEINAKYDALATLEGSQSAQAGSVGVGGDVNFTAKGGNKVVDEKGEPIMVYHATNSKEIEGGSFRVGKRGSWGAGVYFADTEKLAKSVKMNDKANVVKAKVLLKNPLIVTEEEYNKLINKYGVEGSINRYLLMNGYDGAIRTNYRGGKEYFVLDPKQIQIINEKTSESDKKIEGKTIENNLESLEDYQKNRLFNITPSKYFGRNGVYGLQSVVEAYYEAKADGSNPELVKAVEQSLKETPQQSTEDVSSKIEELKAKLARARSIKSKAKIQEELDALTITEAVEPVTQPVVQPVETVTRDLADSLFPEVTNLNDNQITKSKMRILWNANKDIIIKKWGVESFDKFYNLAKLDPKVTEWTINNCK